MATRAIAGVIRKTDGTAWANVPVRAELRTVFATEDETHPPMGQRATTDAAGAFSMTIAVPETGTAEYLFTIPGNEQFTAHLALGDGSAIDFETLVQGAYEIPDDDATVAALIAAAIAAAEIGDLADVSDAAPNDGDVPTWDADTGEWVFAPAAGGGEVAWGDITDTPTTLAGYGITDAAALIHTHDNRYYTEAETDALLADFLTQAETDALYSPLGHDHAWGAITGKPTTLAGYGLATEVDALLDGYIPLPAAPDNGDVLTWNGSAWVASAPGGGGDYLPLTGGTLTGALLLPDGTAGSPALDFGADTGTGIYRSGNDQISLALGGGEFIRFRKNTGAEGAIDLPNGRGINGLSSGIEMYNFSASLSLHDKNTSYLRNETHGTNVVFAALVHCLNSTGTAATGFGWRESWQLESSTTANQDAGHMDILWNDATHATRKADMVFSAYDSGGAREFLRGRATGSAPAIGFLGATPAARQTVSGSRGGNAALASLLTALATLGLITDSSS